MGLRVIIADLVYQLHSLTEQQLVLPYRCSWLESGGELNFIDLKSAFEPSLDQLLIEYLLAITQVVVGLQDLSI